MPLEELAVPDVTSAETGNLDGVTGKKLAAEERKATEAAEQDTGEVGYLAEIQAVQLRKKASH